MEWTGGGKIPTKRETEKQTERESDKETRGRDTVAAGGAKVWVRSH